MNRLTSELCYELLGETRAALLECRQRGLWAWAAAYSKRFDSLQGMLIRVKKREEQHVGTNGYHVQRPSLNGHQEAHEVGL